MMRFARTNTDDAVQTPGKAANDLPNGETVGGLPWAWARHCRSRYHRARRRGVAIVLVLGLISIALAMAYALLRSQSLNVLVQGNGSLRNEARAAAISGLAVGLQRMSNSGWSGVNSTATGTLSSTDSYSVTFTAGDPNLASHDPNQPYRVTVVSTGYANSSLLQSSQQASYRVRAVVALSPRQLGAQPTNWSTMVQYSLYQLGGGQTSIDPPCQIAGPVYLQGALVLGNDYSWALATSKRFFSDLNAMRLAGQPDERPLTGPLSLPTAPQSGQTVSALVVLGLAVINVPITPSPSIPLPTNLTTYQIYPGGPVYTVGAVPSNASSVTLGPDTIKNPLGIYFTDAGTLTTGVNLTVNGTLICGNNLTVTGAGTVITPVNLPPLDGSSTPIQLPALVCAQNVACNSPAGATFNGLVLAGNQFSIGAGPQATTVSVVGPVLTAQFGIGVRNEWNESAGLWSLEYSLFKNQLSLGTPPRIAYFPTWLSGIGLNPNPTLTVTPNPTVLTYQWQDLTAGPIFVVNPADGGLRWTLISWTENV
jgi:hypothetical protein